MWLWHVNAVRILKFFLFSSFWNAFLRVFPKCLWVRPLWFITFLILVPSSLLHAYYNMTQSPPAPPGLQRRLVFMQSSSQCSYWKHILLGCVLEWVAASVLWGQEALHLWTTARCHTAAWWISQTVSLALLAGSRSRTQKLHPSVKAVHRARKSAPLNHYQAACCCLTSQFSCWKSRQDIEQESLHPWPLPGGMLVLD